MTLAILTRDAAQHLRAANELAELLSSGSSPLRRCWLRRTLERAGAPDARALAEGLDNTLGARVRTRSRRDFHPGEFTEILMGAWDAPARPASDPLSSSSAAAVCPLSLSMHRR